MHQSNGGSAASLLLFIVDSPSWAGEIRAELTRSGFDLNIVTSADDVNKLCEEQRPDAILTLASNASLQATHPAAGDTDNAFRPLNVLITETASSPAKASTADLILAPSPDQVLVHLQSALRLRAENLELQQRLRALEDANRRLKDALQSQKRSNDEIEILKNAIVRNVSHELKTPLLQVKSAVSLLSEDPGNTKLIDYAIDATARLETLVKNITLLGSSLDISLGPVIVRDAVEYSRRNLRRIWQHKDDAERIKVDLQEGLPPVLADKQGLSTVLQLLIDNGLKFSRRAVEVGAIRLGDHVRLSVRDHGIGIARDQIDAIFETFYQVDSSTTRRYGGTGVGLAIARLILDRHNSQILVDSEEGHGSTFSFLLPAVRL